jgi:hypothetical protein
LDDGYLIFEGTVNPPISFVLAFNHAFSFVCLLASAGHYFYPLLLPSLFDCFQDDALLVVDVFHQLVQARFVLIRCDAGLFLLYDFINFRRFLGAYEAKLVLRWAVFHTIVSLVPIFCQILLDVALSFFGG